MGSSNTVTRAEFVLEEAVLDELVASTAAAAIVATIWRIQMGMKKNPTGNEIGRHLLGTITRRSDLTKYLNMIAGSKENDSSET